MATEQEIRAEQVKEILLGRREAPTVSWRLEYDSSFGPNASVVLRMVGIPEHGWVFSADSSFTTLPSINRGLTLSRNFLGDTVRISYDRRSVSQGPDHLVINYRMEHTASGESSSGQIIAFHAIRKLTTSNLSR